MDRSDVSGAASLFDAGSNMMMTSGEDEAEAIRDDDPETESISAAGNGDELQQRDERYTGRHRTGPDDHADGSDSAQPSA